MKHFLLILGLTFTYTLTNAGHHPARSSVSFFTEGPIEMSVTLNGYLLNRYPSTWVEANYLRPGRHVVRIKAYGPRRVKHLTRVIYVSPGSFQEFRIGAGHPHADLYMVNARDRFHYRRPAYRFQIDMRNQGYGHHHGKKQHHHDEPYRHQKGHRPRRGG